MTLASQSDGGRLLATAGKDGTVCLWDGKTGQGIGEPLNLGAEPQELVFPASPKEQPRVMAVGKDGSVQVWDAKTGRPLHERFRPEGEVTRVLFWVNYVFAATKAGAVHAWSVPKMAEAFPPLSHDGEVTHLAISSEERSSYLLTADKAGTVRKWNLSTGEPVGPPRKHGAELTEMHRAVPLVTAGKDGRVLAWDPATDQPRVLPFKLRGRSRSGPCHARPCGCSRSRARRRASGTPRRGNRWGRRSSTKGGSSTRPFRKAMPTCRGVTVSGAEIRRWDGRTGTLIVPPAKLDGAVRQVIAPNAGAVLGRFVALVTEKEIRQWDPSYARPLGEPFKHGGDASVAWIDPARVVLVNGAASWSPPPASRRRSSRGKA